MAHRILLGNVAAALLSTACLAASPVDPAAVNAAFGSPIWTDDNLWDDSDAAVAERLGWRMESRTSAEASFRRYAPPGDRILGARPFSLALYGRSGRVEQISMVFANKGDVEDARSGVDYKRQILEDTRTISEALTRALGPSNADRFGQGVRTGERVERWDWNGHAILLAAPAGEYVAVRIVPTALANGETQNRVSDAALRETLQTRVERRPNGDVVLRDIPMVNQGPKGYCVPATWERALRYLGIPADMYTLAMAGQTAAGGGTSVQGMMAGANEIVRRAGRRLVSSSGRITPRRVASSVDAGLPIMWTMLVEETLDREISRRSVQRREVSDWAAYRAGLEPARKAARRLRPSLQNAHVCMIIGYNLATDEVAISDSWGPEYAERWMTAEEANAVSQGEFTVVNW